MRWEDRVYGDMRIDDRDLLALIATPTFQRLRGIRQAGPSALAFPFKTVTRFEHSLGVHVLLRRLGAPRKEQVAGLLHDISHTAFSHAVDFLVDSDEQDHHEDLKPEFLHRPDLARAIEALGYDPADFRDDSVYPLLERPLPWLCADRVDYFLRDAIACDVLDRPTAARFLDHLAVAGDFIVFDDIAVAREAVARFAVMNEIWWAGPTEAFIYNNFADALREGIRIGAIRQDDLLTDDETVLAKLRAADSPKIGEILRSIEQFEGRPAPGFVARVEPKVRRIDPPVLVRGEVRKLSEWL